MVITITPFAPRAPYNDVAVASLRMVVDAISTYGVVVGNIEILNPDEIIGAYSTVDKTAYDVLQYLSEIAQARWTTRLVDENTIAVDFYDPTLMPQADDLEYTKEYSYWSCFAPSGHSISLGMLFPILYGRKSKIGKCV